MLNISSVDRGTVVTRFVDFSWIDNSYGNNGKALVRLYGLTTWRFFLWRIYGLPLRIYGDCLLRFDSGLQCEAEVLSRNLLCILKGRYLLKRRKVIISSFGSSRGRVID